MYISWIEIKRFLKDSYKLIIVGTIVFSILFGISITLLNNSRRTEAPTTSESGLEEIEMDNIFDSSPAYFQFYSEYVDMGQFTNVTLFRQYLNLSSIKEDIEDETGVDISAIEEEIKTTYNIEEFSVFQIVRDETSNLYTFITNTGDEEDNLKVSEYYFSIITEREIPFLQDKLIHTFVEPKLAADMSEESDLEEAGDIAQETTSPINSILTIVRNIIVGFIIGFVIMIGIALLKALFSKYTNYSFAYDIDDNDSFFIYDPSLNNADKVGHFVGLPFASEKLILSQSPLNRSIKDLLTGNVDITFDNDQDSSTTLIEERSIMDVKINDGYKETIIIVRPNMTSRKWYKSQREVLKLSNTTVKVIQINE